MIEKRNSSQDFSQDFSQVEGKIEFDTTILYSYQGMPIRLDQNGIEIYRSKMNDQEKIAISIHKNVANISSYSSIIKEIQLFKFEKIAILSLAKNNIISIDRLPKLNIPSLKQLNMSSNRIISTRSLIKVCLPFLQIIDLRENPLIYTQNIFKGHFPHLKDIKMSALTYSEENLIWGDRVLWRIKNPNRFEKQSYITTAFSSFYLIKRFTTTYRQLDSRMQPVSWIKYRQMLEQKPKYFSQQQQLIFLQLHSIFYQIHENQ